MLMANQTSPSFIVRLAGLIALACVYGALLLSPALRAEEPSTFDGRRLLESCRASMDYGTGSAVSIDEVILAAVCRSYVTGFIEGQALKNEAALSKVPYCLPSDGLSASDAARTVHAYLTRHPALLQLPANVLVASSLVDKFPCSIR